MFMWLYLVSIKNGLKHLSRKSFLELAYGKTSHNNVLKKSQLKKTSVLQKQYRVSICHGFSWSQLFRLQVESPKTKWLADIKSKSQCHHHVPQVTKQLILGFQFQYSVVCRQSQSRSKSLFDKAFLRLRFQLFLRSLNIKRSIKRSSVLLSHVKWNARSLSIFSVGVENGPVPKKKGHASTCPGRTTALGRGSHGQQQDMEG